MIGMPIKRLAMVVVLSLSSMVESVLCKVRVVVLVVVLAILWLVSRDCTRLAMATPESIRFILYWFLSMFSCKKSLKNG